MDGELRSPRVAMSKRYIARDPRTGKPIQTGGSKARNEVTYEPTKGPWMALTHEEVMRLAEGEVEFQEVHWMGQAHRLERPEGVRGLSSVRHGLIRPAHGLLLNALADNEPKVRIAGLQVLPEFAVRRSDELFDWLSVLLDDENKGVRKAASEALARAAPTFPSGVRSSLELELRSTDGHRRRCAWDGLNALADTWPDVVADHVDSLLLEANVELRRKAATMLRKIIARKSSAVWDLVSWALNDEDVVVRRTAAKTIAQLASHDTRMATMFAERAVGDADAEVRLSAIKAIQRLNRGHGRACDLILAGARPTMYASDEPVSRCCPSSLAMKNSVAWWMTSSRPNRTPVWSSNSWRCVSMPPSRAPRPRRTQRWHLRSPSPKSTGKSCTHKARPWGCSTTVRPTPPRPKPTQRHRDEPTNGGCCANRTANERSPADVAP